MQTPRVVELDGILRRLEAEGKQDTPRYRELLLALQKLKEPAVEEK